MSLPIVTTLHVQRAGGQASDAMAPPCGPGAARIAAVFAAGGLLCPAIGGYRPRPSQAEMAQAVGQAIRQRSILMAEAGTGTGKTFAYLVPAMLEGGKTIISTGTKTLQDQLYARDIPTVQRALQTPLAVALLKGRANYVCHYHLERTLAQGRATTRDELGQLRAIARFMRTTTTGDRAELTGVPEHAAIWSQVTSTRDNCRGAECAYAQECFLLKARRDAQQADLVVVNHHLFFADMALKETGTVELLPSADTVIFDEAHQLPQIATLFFGDMVSTSHILDWARDLLAEGLARVREIAWSHLIGALEKAVRELRLALPAGPVRMAAAQLRGNGEFARRLCTLRTLVDNAVDILHGHAQRAEALQQLRQRGTGMAQQLAQWRLDCGSGSSETIYWAETFATTLQLHSTPVSIAPIFRKQLGGKRRAWIFTSATLAVKNDFRLFADQMGLQGEPSRSWPSPFDYARQGLLFVPEDLPAPHDSQYTDALIDCALPIIQAAGGRTFFLCTTLRAMRRVAERLATLFQQRRLPFPLLVQGDCGRTELLQRFRRAGNAVLIGSQSFWEGIDVRGDALSLVIIDKLPFAPPDDPVLAARCEVMQRQGQNSFMQHHLPEAIISLKQGAGRLIRDDADKGVLMIGDARLISKPYGKRIWQSLPPFRRTRSAIDVIAFFHHIAGARAVGPLKKKSSGA